MSFHPVIVQRVTSAVLMALLILPQQCWNVSKSVTVICAKKAA